MNEADIEKIVTVIPLNKDSDNIIFIEASAISGRDLQALGKALKAKKANYNALVMTYGNPHEAVKLVTVDKIKEIQS